MDKIVLEKYIRAGEIAHKAMKIGLQMIKPNAKLLDICEKVEKKIYNEGAAPAFPVNISINNIAAHYTSPFNDKNVLRKGMLVKLDIGVHVDGYIADMARSVIVEGKKHKDLINAPKLALERVEDILKAGVNTNQLGKAIEKAIKELGYTPVKDLTGHSLERYNLHAGISIPNVGSATSLFSPKLREGMAVAIEPFATTGTKGSVYNGPHAYIFSITKNAEKYKSQLSFLIELKKRFKTLPFALRWVRWIKPKKVERLLNSLAANNVVYKYHVLYDRDGGIVSQYENTYIITKNGFIKTTEP